jgi:hypothetical protein
MRQVIISDWKVISKCLIYVMIMIKRGVSDFFTNCSNQIVKITMMNLFMIMIYGYTTNLLF